MYFLEEKKMTTSYYREDVNGLKFKRDFYVEEKRYYSRKNLNHTY